MPVRDSRAHAGEVGPRRSRLRTKVPGGLSYEPKWDGFRAIVSRDGETSRSAAAAPRRSPGTSPNSSRRSARCCPSRACSTARSSCPRASRRAAARLGVAVPAHPPGGSPRAHARRTRPRRCSSRSTCSPAATATCIDEPFSERRAAPRAAPRGAAAPVHLARTTRTPTSPGGGSSEFEGAGLDGVVAKPLAPPTRRASASMLKIKHASHGGRRRHGLPRPQERPGRRLAAARAVRRRGPAAAGRRRRRRSRDARRLELIDELEPLVARDEAGAAVEKGETSAAAVPGPRTRRSFVRLRPERVLEVRYDQLEGGRFRHSGAVRAVAARPRPARRARTSSSDPSRPTTSERCWTDRRFTAEWTGRRHRSRTKDPVGTESDADSRFQGCCLASALGPLSSVQFSGFLLGCTRSGSPGIFGKSGGNGSSPSPSARSRCHHSAACRCVPGFASSPPTGRRRSREPLGHDAHRERRGVGTPRARPTSSGVDTVACGQRRAGCRRPPSCGRGWPG